MGVKKMMNDKVTAQEVTELLAKWKPPVRFRERLKRAWQVLCGKI